MNIRQTSRTSTVLQELGQRIERLRLRRNQSLDLDNVIPDIEVSPFEISGSRKTPRRRASRSDG